jgi:Flp pilus assembly protein TadD
LAVSPDLIWREKNVTTSAAEKLAGDGDALSENGLRDPDMSREGAARVWRQLAKMMLGQNSLKLAIEALLEAVSLDPNDGETFGDLGSLLYRTGQIEASISALQQASRLAPDNAAVWYNLGNALSRTDDNGGAKVALYEAVRLEPRNSTFVRTLAMHLLETGRKAAARAAFAWLVEISPTDGSAHLNLAGLTDYGPDDPHIAAMQALLKEPGTALDDRIGLGFALFKALNRAGDHPRAFSYLEVANRLRRETIEYDFEHERVAFGSMKQFFTSDLLESIRDAGFAEAAPIFIVGMPRSGTTLTEQILSSHSAVVAGGDSTALGDLVREFFGRVDPNKLTFADVGFSADGIAVMANFYLSRLGVAQNASQRVTDKMPLNFRWVGIAASIFPNAHFIHCMRDPIETCFSIYSNHFVTGDNRYGYDLSEVGTYYREYMSLMDHWKTVLLDRVHEVHLEDIVADQEVETRLMLEFCGLGFERRCLDFQENTNRVRTLSATQVRKPIEGRHADRIRPYLPYLGRLREELADLA